MGKVKGFKEFDRIDEKYLPIRNRLKNYNEFTVKVKKSELESQSARCMDCGVPFCHSGCPLGNLIPDFNDLVYNKKWKDALEGLHSTNNFPEFTGRLCPAPCEASCVLGIIDPPVSIELIEKNIIEEGFKNGWIKPVKPKIKTGKKIAIIGSGPAGLAASQQLNSVGHNVTVFERDNKIGGLLRYGIPDFKLEKNIIDRRVNILKQEGIKFKCSVNVGEDISIKELQEKYDAVLISTGSTKKRSLDIPGSDLHGIEQAMDFLTHNNKFVDKQINAHLDRYNAKDKNVIVIGGGDTGSDCIGTSHQEGVSREWSILTKKFIGDKHNNIIGLETVNVEFDKVSGKFTEIPNTNKTWKCDMVILALGFTGPEESLPNLLNVDMNDRGNISSNSDYQTKKNNIFTAGDCRRGQSLIVWAISEGREASYHIDKYLMGKSDLPRKNSYGDL